LSSEYDKYEKDLEEMQKVNQEYLDGFKKSLKSSGLTDKTIRNHVSNVDFYINDFLCYYDIQEVQAGCYDISGFLGSWFIRKAAWSSSGTIKSMAASIKKFYKFMLDKGVVKQEDYNYLCDEIKEEMSVWLDKMTRYNNLSEDEDFEDY